MESTGVIFHLVIVLVTALVSGVVARRLKQPVILGYLVGGLVVGSLTKFGISNRAEISTFAELGVALLMFLLGMEFTYGRFKRVGNVVIFGAIIQILATIVAGTYLLTLLGIDFYSSLFLASLFSLSSTAVVVRILSEQGMANTIFGEIAVGWLIVQDLAVIPLAVLLPLVGKAAAGAEYAGSFNMLLINSLKSMVFVGIIFFAGRYFLAYIFKYVVKQGQREQLLIMAFALCIGFALITSSLGLSFALGAFIAGVMVSHTPYMQAVFAEVRPLRDLFSSVFFVSLGFLVNIGGLIANYQLVLVIVILFLALKFLIVFGLTFSWGYHSRIAFYTAVSLVQVGEFAFVLGQIGFNSNLISDSIYSIILTVAIISIIITPLLMKNSRKVYEFLAPTRKKFRFIRSFFGKTQNQHPGDEIIYRDHVVLLGYGRVGKYVGRALVMEEIPFVVVDFNKFTVDRLKNEKIPAIYGDPSDLDVLKFADVESARVVVVTIPDRLTQELAIANSLTLNRKVVIICRSHFEEDRPILASLGVHQVVNPEFEGALSLTAKLLSYFGLEREDFEGKIQRLKIEYGLNSLTTVD